MDSLIEIKGHVIVVKANCFLKKKNVIKVDKKQPKKMWIEIVWDSVINNIEERGMNEVEQVSIKVQKYPIPSSADLAEQVNPCLKKGIDQIIIYFFRQTT